MHTSEFVLIKDALLGGQANRVKTLSTLAIENGIPPLDILNKALLPGMDIIGDEFRNRKIYISDVLIASRAMHAGLHVIKAHSPLTTQVYKGKIVIGTVAGDLHDIGKNLVTMMLRSSGFEVIDLGVDVQPEDFETAIKMHNPDILALSAMLTTTRNMIPDTIQKIEHSGLRSNIKILVGGAPTTRDFAHVSKADGFAIDAIMAIDVANELLKTSA